MTQHTASLVSRTGAVRGSIAMQGMDHGYVRKHRRALEFTLWAWLPRAILGRGGAPNRDDERAYRDIQAACDRSDWE